MTTLATSATALTGSLAAATSSPSSEDPDITTPGKNDDELRAKAKEVRARDPRPNVLLLFTDQQTISALSCTGNRWVDTPNIDSLAKRGVLFTKSYCASPICGPSRASMITGLPPHQTGVRFNEESMKPGLPTIGTTLREAGYYTAWTGKWHLPESFLRKPTDTAGFHHRPLPEGVRFASHGDQTDFLTAMDAEFFLRWEAAKQAKPWFLGVSLHNPHDICYHAMEKGKDQKNLEFYPPLPPNFQADPDEPEALQMRRDNGKYGRELAYTKNWDEARWREYLQTYCHLVSQVDRAVGEVLRSLKQGGWDDDTLVIFTSDHGEGVAAHQWVTKLSLYEESAAVPLIFSYPGHIPENAVNSTTIASGLDLLPTICAFTGTTPPPNAGKNLLPAIEGAKPGDENFAVCELDADSQRPEIAGRMVRSSRFKYCVYTPGTRREQLFDMDSDPGETKNLAADPAFSAQLQTHRKMLQEWAKKTSDPFPLIPAS